MSSALMRGLELPPALPRGKPAPEAVEPWLALVEELMGRGVRTPSQLRSVIGVGYRTAQRWMEVVTERWSSGLTDDRVNWRRESLYSEADQVARAAWYEAAHAGTPSERASLFKVVLMANQRKASLTGLEGLEVKIKKEVTQHTVVDLVARVEAEHSLAPGALERIGREAALALSGGCDLHQDQTLEKPPRSLAKNEGGLILDVGAGAATEPSSKTETEPGSKPDGGADSAQLEDSGEDSASEQGGPPTGRNPDWGERGTSEILPHT